ncbi:hypothetical protein PAPYR_12632 [Paratrimastix pyriformis]|uniref:Uncharacterized protein n=1 Tax=Paratrimastix pyriformis TaxID=342808 RepID=A0ABQ8U5B9_9EUKA|nr:hypothetical protein PAPYR_12632 [Paratrimastix pyriformis]
MRYTPGQANIVDVNAALEQKADQPKMRALGEALAAVQHDKADAALVAEHMGQMADLSKQLILKANMQDVLTLLDAKPIPPKDTLKRSLRPLCFCFPVTSFLLEGQAGAEDVVKQVGDVTQSIEQRLAAKVDLPDFTRSIEQQRVVNESLSGEQCVGRWIWRSGKTKQGHGVPWNIQVANSAPETFLWERDKVTLTVIQPGLYEVTFGFFADKKPAVQLLVNGEPVLSAINSASYVMHHSSGRLTAVGAHPEGNITGLTMIDFLALPARARLAVSYNGEEGAEGFFGLRKLA